MLETLVSGNLNAAGALTLLGARIAGAEAVLGRETGWIVSTDFLG